MTTTISKVNLYRLFIIAGAVLIAMGVYNYLRNSVFDFSLLHDRSTPYKIGFFIGHFALLFLGLILFGIGIKLFVKKQSLDAIK